MKQLKTTEIPAIREQYLLAQSNLCALCSQPIEPGKAVLDHDHRSGLIRGVLHRGCNALEGNITNALPRNLVTPERLRAIFANWEHYHAQYKDMLHPTFRTPEQRKVRAKKRALARRKKKP